jgi:hypothetical protein
VEYLSSSIEWGFSIPISMRYVKKANRKSSKIYLKVHAV